MPNYRAQARRAARRYGLNPRIFERQIQQESGFAEDVIHGRRVSSAGAQGIAQIMPATARGWGVDPLKPRQALDAAARNMAKYVRQYGGYENALRAYNAGPARIEASKGYSETNAYVRNILGGRSPRGLSRPQRGTSGGGGGRRGGTSARFSPGQAVNVAAALQALGEQAAPEQRSVTLPAAPAFSASAAVPEGYRGVQTSGAPNAQRFDAAGALDVLGALANRDLPSDVTQRGGRIDRRPVPGGKAVGDGRVDLRPRGGYAGTTGPLIALSRLAQSYGPRTTSGKRDTVSTASGGVSDHYRGNTSANARDLGGTQAQMDRAAVAVARALGVKYRKGQPLVATVNRNGIRYQLLYRTNVGGDHFDHLHIGAKRI